MKKLFTTLLFLIASAVVVISQTPEDSLIAKFPFNNNCKDESGNGNNGITYGGVEYCANRFDYASRSVEFNGTDSYIDIGYMDSLNVNLNKTINDAGAGTVFSIEVNRGASAVFNPGVIRLDLRDESDRYFTIYIDKPEIFDNNWHNIIFVIDDASNNVGSVYVDNEYIEKDPSFGSESPDGFDTFDHPLVIGAANNRGTIETYFKGKLDDVRFYS